MNSILFIINQQDKILKRLAKSEPQLPLTAELKVRHSQSAFYIEVILGIAIITLPWLLLMNFTIKEAGLGLAIMAGQGILIISLANGKITDHKFDFDKEGVLYQNERFKWNDIVEIQHVRRAKRRGPEVLRLITKIKAVDLPFNSELTPKTHEIMDFLKEQGFDSITS